MTIAWNDVKRRYWKSRNKYVCFVRWKSRSVWVYFDMSVVSYIPTIRFSENVESPKWKLFFFCYLFYCLLSSHHTKIFWYYSFSSIICRHHLLRFQLLSIIQWESQCRDCQIVVRIIKKNLELFKFWTEVSHFFTLCRTATQILQCWGKNY